MILIDKGSDELHGGEAWGYKREALYSFDLVDESCAFQLF